MAPTAISRLDASDSRDSWADGFACRVRTVDERFSSVMVEHGADRIDDEAAAVILPAYFDEQSAVA